MRDQLEPGAIALYGDARQLFRVQSTFSWTMCSLRVSNAGCILTFWQQNLIEMQLWI